MTEQITQELEVPLDPADMHLTPPELAKRLRLHVVTLANWRVKGKGPKFVKFGRAIRYPLSRVEAWETEQTRSNTAVM